MNLNRFVIPATFAAAIHAALLIASREVLPPVAVDPQPPEPHRVQEVKLEPIELPAEDDAGERTEQKPGGAPAPESLPEPPLRPVDSGFEIPVPVIAPVTDRPPTNRIPPTTFTDGDPNGNPWAPTGRPVDVRGLDREPRATVQIAPDYPFDLRRQGVEGTVWVELLVGSDGTVTRAHATRSTHRDFETPTVRAVQKWRFEPGKRQGRPTSFTMTVPVHFSLNGG